MCLSYSSPISRNQGALPLRGLGNQCRFPTHACDIEDAYNVSFFETKWMHLNSQNSQTDCQNLNQIVKFKRSNNTFSDSLFRLNLLLGLSLLFAYPSWLTWWLRVLLGLRSALLILVFRRLWFCGFCHLNFRTFKTIKLDQRIWR